jgi:hypothetical protein
LADRVPTRPIQPPREALVNQQVSDGCTRFALKVVNGVPLVEALYNTNGCQTDQLQLQADSTPTFNATTGTLRVPIVMKNVGTVAVVAPARIRFNADSSQFLNGQGQVIAGSPDILATNYDTANTSGRSGQWRYDTLLAASGQVQVLAPEATTGRRWLEFTGTSWSQTIRIKLPTVATQVGGVVPALPPDSTPRAHFSDRSNWITDPVYFAGTIIRDVLEVHFRIGTSQAARENAIAAVGGTVIGGAKLYNDGDGWYYVLVPITNSTLVAAKQSLEASADVELVAYVVVGGVNNTAKRPNDGPGWQSNDWMPDLNRAFGDNWALERVRAPLAWGCSTGLTTTKVAVVDHAFFASRDFPTVSGVPNTGVFVLDTLSHGTRVASVLSAEGGNGDLITGMMWNANRRFYEHLANSSGTVDTTISPDSLVDQSIYWISRAANDGARVINLSSSLYWPHWAKSGIDPATQLTFPYGDATAAITNLARRLSTLLNCLKQRGIRPIVVLAAGNQGLDAKWAGFPFAADPTITPDAEVRARIIVVAGSDASNNRWADSARVASGYGGLVDVFAPSASVASIGKGNVVSQHSGTSLAAPQVAGTVGLLFSFDDQIEPDSVKSYLVSSNSVHVSDNGRSIPLLDAYAALRTAAQRPGAPLCGNPLAFVASYDTSANTTTMSVDAKRGSGPGSTERVTQFSIPGLNAVPIYVPHGGRDVLVDLLDQQGLRRVATYNGSAWQTLAQPWQVVSNPDVSGASWSSRGWSHDGDTALYATVSYNSGFLTANASFSLWSNGAIGPALTSFSNLPDRWTNPTTGIGPYGGGAGVGGVMSPTGGFAIVVVTDGSAVGR